VSVPATWTPTAAQLTRQSLSELGSDGLLVAPGPAPHILRAGQARHCASQGSWLGRQVPAVRC